MPALGDLSDVDLSTPATDAQVLTYDDGSATWQAADLPAATVTVSTADVSNPPTDAELDAALGDPATVGAGYIRLLDDNDADTHVYLVASNGTSWWYAALTKAT